jgi:CheY-like chemotaxis protein
MALVLVVDDEDVLADMIAALVEDLGHEARVASNGREALRSLAVTTQSPALIISDIMMPQMSGLELLRALRADDRYQSVPIILMSAAARPSDTHEADLFIPKPFDINKLIGLISTFVEAREAEA